METLNLGKKQLANLKPISLNPLVTNTESRLYVNAKEIIKIFYDAESKIIKSKLNVVKSLNENSSSLPSELVLPKRLVRLNDNLVGYTMEYIFNNQNLAEILASKISLKEKLFYLKQVLTIIEKMEYASCFDTKAYLGDIQESNFILDKDKNIIRAVDTDSIVFNDAYPCESFYLSFNLCTSFFPKKYPRGLFDNPIPNHNSSYLSFIYMLLSTISQFQVSLLNLNEYFRYLDNLKTLGLSKEVTDALFNVFTTNDNYFPKEYLRDFLKIPEEKLLYKNLK